MGKGPEETFLQRGYADGQQAREKMLNIVHRQRKANENHDETSPHTCQNGHDLKEHYGHFPGGPVPKNPPASAGDIRDEGSIPGWGRSPEKGVATLSSPGGTQEQRSLAGYSPWGHKSQTRLSD